jgi:ATP-binding cassette subfamily B protein
MLWKSGPGLVTGSVGLRILGALVPLAMLAVTRWIIDNIIAHSKGADLSGHFWWFVALEFGLLRQRGFWAGPCGIAIHCWRTGLPGT